MNDECKARLAAWAGKAYQVIGEDLEELGEWLTRYFPNRAAYEQSRDLIMAIIISGCPSEVVDAHQAYLKYKGKHKATGAIKEIREQWKKKYSYRVNRMFDLIGDSMYGRILKTKAEVLEEIEADNKKKSRLEEKENGDDTDASVSDLMAYVQIDDNKVGEVMEDIDEDVDEDDENVEMEDADEDVDMEQTGTGDKKAKKKKQPTINVYEDDDNEPEIISVLGEDDDGNPIMTSTCIEKIPERFLTSDGNPTFKGKRDRNRIIVSELQDYYATPEEASATILPYLIKFHSGQTIWDACDGYGEMSTVWKDAGFKVITTDFYTKGDTDACLDYLTQDANFDYDVLVINPPFSKKHEFMERAINLKKPFIMLLPLEMVARKRTTTPLKNSVYRGGVIVPAPKFTPRKKDGTAKYYTVNQDGVKKERAVAVGDCFWLFGFPNLAVDEDNISMSTSSSSRNLKKGVIMMNQVVDMTSMVEMCM